MGPIVLVYFIKESFLVHWDTKERNYSDSILCSKGIVVRSTINQTGIKLEKNNINQFQYAYQQTVLLH